MPQDIHKRFYKANEASAADSLASATKTASGNSAAFDTGHVESINAQLVVSAASGTTPSMTVKLQTTADGTNFYDVASFPAETTTDAGTARIFGPLGVQSRWAWVISGTTPSFTFAIGTSVDWDS